MRDRSCEPHSKPWNGQCSASSASSSSYAYALDRTTPVSPARPDRYPACHNRLIDCVVSAKSRNKETVMVEDEQHHALAERFDGLRPHLQEVAYRMPGSDSDALDAVQESWLRLSSAGSVPLGDLRGWLTVVVGRTCL